MLRSLGVLSLTPFCVLWTLAVPTVLGASWQRSISYAGEVVQPLSWRDAIGVALSVDHSADRAYSVFTTVGQSSISFSIATDLGDFVVISTDCQTASCKHYNSALYNASASFTPYTNTTVPLLYDGEAAPGRIGQDAVNIGGLNIPDQTLAAISSFNATNLFNGTVGILGLGFPVESNTANLGGVVAPSSDGTASSNTSASDFLTALYANGPIITTLSSYGDISEPLFSLTFNPNVSQTGNAETGGQLTIGSLPAGVDNSSLTWAPVRLYDIGLNGTVPLHWEVEIDAVFLDGSLLPGSSQVPKATAMVDSTATATGGPKDAVDAILAAISSTTPVCTGSHTLSFQIGGKFFSIAPQDLVIPTGRGCAVNAEAIDSGSPCSNSNSNSNSNLNSNLTLALYSWRLGAAFLRSNLVAFHYGNTTHPGVEPPRMGFVRSKSNDARAHWGRVGPVARCGWLAIVAVTVGIVMVL